MRCVSMPLLAAAIYAVPTPSEAQGRGWVAERYAQCVEEQSFDALSTERVASTEPCRDRNQVDHNDAAISIIYADPFVARTAPVSDLRQTSTALMFDLSYRVANSVVLSQGYEAADFYRVVFVIGGQQFDRRLTLARSQNRGCDATGRGLLATSGCEYRELLLLALSPDDIAASERIYQENHAARIIFRLHAQRGGSLDMWIDAGEIVGMAQWGAFSQ